MRNLPKATILILAVLLFVSCKKVNDQGNELDSRSKKLCNTWWKVVSFKSNKAIDYDNDGNANKDVYEQMKACEKDDLIHFGSGGHVTSDQKKLCTSEKADKHEGKWSWNSNKTVIAWIYQQGKQKDLSVVNLSKSTFEFTYTEGVYKFDVTMQAQE